MTGVNTTPACYSSYAYSKCSDLYYRYFRCIVGSLLLLQGLDVRLKMIIVFMGPVRSSSSSSDTKFKQPWQKMPILLIGSQSRRILFPSKNNWKLRKDVQDPI